MGSEQIKKIEHTVGWFTQALIVGLLSTVVYFVKDIHSEFKVDHARIEAHETRLATQEFRLSVVESKIK